MTRIESDEERSERRRLMKVAPAGLGDAGSRFFRWVHSAYETDVRDSPVLLELCRTIDEIELLAEAVARDGVVTTGSKGQPVEHPAMAGLRAHRVVLDRLFVRLGLPGAEDEETPLTQAQIRAKRAAAARWQGHRKEAG